MKRRDLLGLLGGAAMAPLSAGGQQAGKPIKTIGVLGLASRRSLSSELRYERFLQGLREADYVEGRNCAIRYLGADWQFDRLPSLAAELVALKPDVIFAGTTPAARAVRQATATIPIVVALMVDPVGDGFVAGLARPEGNVTGFTTIASGLAAKRLGLLREMAPSATRIAVLWHRDSAGLRTSQDMLDELDAAARGLNVRLRSVEVSDPEHLDRVFASLVGEVDALLMAPSHMLFSARKRIVELAAAHRLPATYGVRAYVDAGGLVSYGVDEFELYRRAGGYAARILNGTKVADLPVEQPAKFELVLNAQAAKALGLAIPPAILALADEVID